MRYKHNPSSQFITILSVLIISVLACAGFDSRENKCEAQGGVWNAVESTCDYSRPMIECNERGGNWAWDEKGNRCFEWESLQEEDPALVDPEPVSAQDPICSRSEPFEPTAFELGQSTWEINCIDEACNGFLRWYTFKFHGAPTTGTVEVVENSKASGSYTVSGTNITIILDFENDASRHEEYTGTITDWAHMTGTVAVNTENCQRCPIITQWEGVYPCD
ncbi:MAG: hypothetical protein DWQ07_13730 [Chloroflexi bacterium]|nr:MAG: hypothetical protein DWQ07_13730 [Chloroflexota bacterium]MBL1194930.1 hypothetical protein [Chloroflexota bacterium]NOH12221.1 hypothetical protein [Chloroflexota bacterium]